MQSLSTKKERVPMSVDTKKKVSLAYTIIVVLFMAFAIMTAVVPQFVIKVVEETYDKGVFVSSKTDTGEISLYNCLDILRNLGQGNASYANLATVLLPTIVLIAEVIVVFVCLGLVVYNGVKYYVGGTNDFNVHKYFGVSVAAYLVMILGIAAATFNDTAVRTYVRILPNTYLTGKIDATFMPTWIVFVTFAIFFIAFVYNFVAELKQKETRLAISKHIFSSLSIIVIVGMFFSFIGFGYGYILDMTKQSVIDQNVQYGSFGMLAYYYSLLDVAVDSTKWKDVDLLLVQSKFYNTVVTLCTLHVVALVLFATYIVSSFFQGVKAQLVKALTSIGVICVTGFLFVYCDLRSTTFLDLYHTYATDPYASNGVYLVFVFAIIGVILGFYQFALARRQEKYEV